MYKTSEKSFPVFWIFILASGVIAVAFIHLGICLQQRQVASGQALLARRILVCFALGDEKRDAGEQSSAVKDAGREREDRGQCRCNWRLEEGIRMLLEGGRYADYDIVPLEDPELEGLLETMRGLRSASSLEAEQLFCQKARTLADSLALKVVVATSRVQKAYWLLGIAAVFFFLVNLLFFIAFNLNYQELEKHLMMQKLKAELMQNWPEPLFLIDSTFSLKIINNLAEKYFGSLPMLRSGPYFDRLCHDPVLLERLRKVFAEIEIYGNEKLAIEPERVVLSRGENEQYEVLIFWYRVILAGQDYLLGRIHDVSGSFFGDTETSATRYLQGLAEKFFKVQDEERHLLADELHDGFCQALAVLKMQVSGVEKRIQDEELRAECRKVRQYVAQIIEDVRRLSHDLSPVILDDLGLSEALVHLVNNFTASHNIKALTSVSDLDDYFSENEARNIYRIVQEAINNVGKHAKASLMVLEAEVKPDEISFSIRDDGVGFEVETVRNEPVKAGIGLASMVQRVRLMKGRFTIVSQPGKGTEIRFSIPRK
ncbi:MAG: sensor histidine kinase [Deltaproteobacteria bacterium]|nr:sensor histidine kinase [Deltaproteobacteria bacterium]